MSKKNNFPSPRKGELSGPSLAQQKKWGKAALKIGKGSMPDFATDGSVKLKSGYDGSGRGKK